MIPLATIRELYDYNYWARDRQFEACAVLTADEFRRPLGNSFPSLRDTLVTPAYIRISNSISLFLLQS